MTLDHNPPRHLVRSIPKQRSFPQLMKQVHPAPYAEGISAGGDVDDSPCPTDAYGNQRSPRNCRSGPRALGIKAGYINAEPTYRIGRATLDATPDSRPAAPLRRSRSEVRVSHLMQGSYSDSVGVRTALTLDIAPIAPEPPGRGRRTFYSPASEPPAQETPRLPTLGKKVLSFPSPVCAEAPRPARRKCFSEVGEPRADLLVHDHRHSGLAPIQPEEAPRPTGKRRSRSSPSEVVRAPFGVGDGVAPRQPDPRPIRVFSTAGLLSWT